MVAYCQKCGAYPQNSGGNCLCLSQHYIEIEGCNWCDQTERSTDEREIKIRYLQQRLATAEAECAIYYEIAAAAIGEEQTIALRDAAMRRRRVRMVIVGDKAAPLWAQKEIKRLEADYRALEAERDRLKAENERLLRCLADYPAGNQTEPDVKAALREVDGGKD